MSEELEVKRVETLTLSAYFAARAPEKVPQWYVRLYPPDQDEHPKNVEIPRETDAERIVGRRLGEEEKMEVLQWLDDPGCWDLEGDLAAFQAKYEAAHRNQADAAARYQRDLFFAWRLYYGEMMALMVSQDCEEDAS